MRGSYVSLLIGIALLAVGAFALTAWVTRSPPPAVASASASPATQPLSGGGGDGSQAAQTASEEAAKAPPAAGADAPQHPTSVRGHVERTSAERRHGLVKFRRELKAGLAALREQVAPCDATGASFTLDVESAEGTLRVVEAHLDAGGSAGAEAVACARSALVGVRIPAAAVEPGRRWQLSFAVPQQ
jgi:hypothetical protein